MKIQIQNQSVSAKPARGPALAVLAALLLLAAGCSTLPQNQNTQLRDPVQLAADPANENIRTFRAAAPLATFGGVRVEPVAFAATPGELTPEQRTKLGERLATALRKEIAGAMPAGGAAGGEDLVITSTIVAVEVASTGANVAGFALLGLGLDMGGVIIELEARGARSGERIAAARYVEAGRPWQVKANFSAIGHALTGTEKAAERFARLLAAKK
jgi:hypothetical protein